MMHWQAMRLLKQAIANHVPDDDDGEKLPPSAVTA
jgi:predicted RNase H-like HicB family nuclease